MTKKKILESISNSLKQFLFSIIKFFFYGIITLIPVFFIIWLFNFFSGAETVNLKTVLRMVLEKIFPKAVIFNWVVGITLLLIIIAIGALSPFITKKLYFWIGKLAKNLLREKIKEQSYGTVMFELTKGVWLPGIITGYIKGSENLKGGKILKIFVSTSPVPGSGYLTFHQEKGLIKTNLPPDEIINGIISAGILAPEKIPELVAELERREIISEKNKEKS